MGLAGAIESAPTNLHVLQAYRKPHRLEHRVYDPPAPNATASASGPDAPLRKGRLRLCPYYFVRGGKAQLSGALATFCPPDKKIIHGMNDAALLPCVVQSLNESRA